MEKFCKFQNRELHMEIFKSLMMERSVGNVNLFTRPRRLGKSLNMSMLKCFFEIGSDPSVFNGLKIM